VLFFILIPRYNRQQILILVICFHYYYRVNWSPRHPDIEGEKDFQGYLIHSIRFKHPEYYTGQTVAVLGASFGGLDTAVHLAGYAKKASIVFLY